MLHVCVDGRGGGAFDGDLLFTHRLPYRFEMEGDRKYDDDYDSASLGAMGYQSQEFNADGELEATEDDYYADDDFGDEGMDETDEF